MSKRITISRATEKEVDQSINDLINRGYKVVKRGKVTLPLSRRTVFQRPYFAVVERIKP